MTSEISALASAGHQRTPRVTARDQGNLADELLCFQWHGEGEGEEPVDLVRFRWFLVKPFFLFHEMRGSSIDFENSKVEALLEKFWDPASKRAFQNQWKEPIWYG
jgi:hypothetical protein